MLHSTTITDSVSVSDLSIYYMISLINHPLISLHVLSVIMEKEFGGSQGEQRGSAEEIGA
jgi:hypothetical protein